MPRFLLSSLPNDAGGDVRAKDGEEGSEMCPLFSLPVFRCFGLLLL